MLLPLAEAAGVDKAGGCLPHSGGNRSSPSTSGPEGQEGDRRGSHPSLRAVPPTLHCNGLPPAAALHDTPGAQPPTSFSIMRPARLATKCLSSMDEISGSQGATEDMAMSAAQRGS